MEKDNQENKEKESDEYRGTFANKHEVSGYGGLIIACIIAILFMVYVLLIAYAPELFTWKK